MVRRTAQLNRQGSPARSRDDSAQDRNALLACRPAAMTVHRYAPILLSGMTGRASPPRQRHVRASCGLGAASRTRWSARPRRLGARVPLAPAAAAHLPPRVCAESGETCKANTGCSGARETAERITQEYGRRAGHHDGEHHERHGEPCRIAPVTGHTHGRIQPSRPAARPPCQRQMRKFLVEDFGGCTIAS